MKPPGSLPGKAWKATTDKTATAMSAILEQQIASALSSDTTSDVIAHLITEVETAIIAADKAAEAERDKATRRNRCGSKSLNAMTAIARDG
jgi:hypothetical protein